MLSVGVGCDKFDLVIFVLNLLRHRSCDTNSLVGTPKAHVLKKITSKEVLWKKCYSKNLGMNYAPDTLLGQYLQHLNGY